MSEFVFEKYEFDRKNYVAKFYYSFEEYHFTEEIQFFACHPGLDPGSRKSDWIPGQARNDRADYDEKLLNNALFLAHILIGTSYYKTFPTTNVAIKSGKIDARQADFFNKVFQEGLSQFAYENDLTRANLAQFRPTVDARETARNYDGKGIIALQSGGKDSLLVAEMLRENGDEFSALYFSSSQKYPKVLDDLGAELFINQRKIDRENLTKAAENGGLNGHVPITYIVMSLATIQAILSEKNTILTAVAHEGEEPMAMIDDLPINHQWSKTWDAERRFQDYVSNYISPDIHVGSPLRQHSELAVAELFIARAWAKFGRKFSSCNVANYGQGVDNSELKWCGECAKCANSWLLFAPFVPAAELRATFRTERDLFAKPELTDTFKGLLGVDGVPKPFECVGEIAELRKAYHLAEKNAYEKLPFHVPESDFDYHAKYAHNGDLII